MITNFVNFVMNLSPFEILNFIILIFLGYMAIKIILSIVLTILVLILSLFK